LIVTNKENYLNANDLLESDYLLYDTISPQRYVEIYRLDERPTAVTDFDDSLIETLDLKMFDNLRSLSMFSTVEFVDTIKTNKEYK